MYCKQKQVILNMSCIKRLILASIVMLVFTLQACQPDDEEPFAEDNKLKPAAFTYTAKLNGTAWIGTQNLSVLVKNSLTLPNKEMRISANSADNKLLNITLADASTGVAGDGIAIRTYTLQASGISDASFMHINTTNNTTYNGAYGTVTITKSDAATKKISGTFACTLYKNSGDTLRITNGIITDLPYEITEQ